jgi:predicted permease
VTSAFLLLVQIVYIVIAPIFLMMGIGFLVQKKLGFDIKSLTRLNFWIFVPAFLFVNIIESKLSAHDLSLVMAHFTLWFAIMATMAWQAARVLKASDGLKRAMTSAVLFYNAGNYGIPAAQLAFGAVGVSVQAILVMLVNTTNFTIGLGLSAGSKQGERKRDNVRNTARAALRLPMIYTLILALVWRATQWPIPAPLNTSLHYLSDALVPIALVTLGAQLATLKNVRFTRVIGVTLMLRLIVSPILAYALAVLLKMPTFLTQALVVAASFPAGVNPALLAIEYNNEPEYASAVVFYSTLLSIPTVSLAIFFARGLG